MDYSAEIAVFTTLTVLGAVLFAAGNISDFILDFRKNRDDGRIGLGFLTIPGAVTGGASFILLAGVLSM